MSRGFQAHDEDVRKAARAFADWTRFRSDVRTAFGDMVHAFVLSLRNAHTHRDAAWQAREDEFAAIREKVGDEGHQIHQATLAALMLAARKGHGDHLGEMYQQVSANSPAIGQFFTPYSVSSFMARMAITADLVAKGLAENGYVHAQEPACGAGGMVVAMGEAMRELGHDPATTLRVHAIDIDRICVDMTYVQSTLHGIPCFVDCRDALGPPDEPSAYAFGNVHYAAAVLRDQ